MGQNRFYYAGAFLKTLRTLPGTLLAVMLILTGAVFPKGSPGTGHLCGMLSAGSGGSLLSSTVPQQKQEQQQQVQNILLIGQDRREGESGTRSDSIILCSLHPGSGKAVLTSFLRDLYVPIPGHGKNRVNAAYAFGGAALLRQTLEENFDIVIDGCVEVDFEQFSGILDRLGGVSLTLRADEAEQINRELGSSLREGEQTLTGEEALAYSRIRSLDTDGDFSRTDRQRKVLRAVWDSYKHSTLPSLVRTMGDLLPLIRTDLGSGELLRIAVRVFPRLSELELVSHRIPEQGHCEDRNIGGMAVLVTDLEEAAQMLHGWIGPET